jgi:hypothetical protein
VKNIVFMVFCMFAAVACNSCAPQPAPVPPPAPTVTVDAGPAPEPPPAPPVADAGPQPNVDPSVRDACANLAKIGCAEGGSNCLGRMQLALSERLTPVPLACLVGAHTKDDVHKCGRFVQCP